MEFTWTSNYAQIKQHFKDEKKRYADPDPVSIINAVPYITMLEYGGIVVYDRMRKNSKRGIKKNPKGGFTMRAMYRTTVFNPPRAMVRRSVRVIRNEAIRLCRANRPKGNIDMRRMLMQMANVGIAQIKDFTPVDEDIARQGWMIMP